MRFNRRRDACFPATMAVHIAIRAAAWVSIADATLASPQQQIAAAIPYPVLVSIADATLASPQRTSFNERKPVLDVSIADATLASPQQRSSIVVSVGMMFQSQTRRLLPRNMILSLLSYAGIDGFNRRRDACFPATRAVHIASFPAIAVSIADATLASPQLSMNMFPSWRSSSVSIADATLASPQPVVTKPLDTITDSFNRRRDACFPATNEWLEENHLFLVVSIADATLASPQQEAFLAAPVPS